MSAGASRTSARLGLTLRAVLVTPSEGFRAAVVAAERRARLGSRPQEGYAPYVLAAVGGAALALLWLKLGGLLSLRDATVAEFRGGYLVGTLLLGALLLLAAQALWAPAASRALGGGRRDLRIAWGLAAFPQVGGVAVLLPLDLLIVGPQTFATERISDSLSTAWAAASIALAASLAVWSVWLFARGVAVVAGGGVLQALAAAGLALASLAVVCGAAFASLIALAGATS